MSSKKSQRVINAMKGALDVVSDPLNYVSAAKKASNIVLKRYQDKKNFGKDVESEASQIFMKNYEDRYGKTGWPEAGRKAMRGSKYSNDYYKVEDQVRAMRKKQMSGK